MSNTIYTVYKTTNLINNKIYIGVHATSNPNDAYMGSGIAVKNSIKKHGIDNFKKEILFIYDNQKDAYLTEANIVNLDFINRENTYNLCLGGVGGYKQSKITQFKKSKIEKNYIEKRYITPWGNYKTIKLASTNDVKIGHIRKWCKNSDKIINMRDVSHSSYLAFLSNSPIGKTFKDIGFDYIISH